MNCFAGELRRSVHTVQLGPAQTANTTRVQTSGARPAVGQHQHTGRAHVLHTEFALRRSGPGRLFFRRQRVGAVVVRRQSAERSRKVSVWVYLKKKIEKLIE